MTTVSDRDMARQIDLALADYASGFDIEAIVRDLIDRFGRVHVSEVPSGVFWDIVAKHSHAPEGVI